MLKRKNHEGQVALFIGLLVMMVCPLFSQLQRITVDISKTYQKMESFTASDAWCGNFVGQYWDDKQKEQISAWLFSQQYDKSGNPAGIGLSMWRVNLGGGTLEQDSANIMPFERRAESFLATDKQTYDWNKCAGQQYFMQKATEYGCNNFLLFSNSPLVQYTKNGKGWSDFEYEANIKPDCYEKYAAYLADVSKYFSEKKGWHVAYISPINEPQVRWTTPKQEGSPWKSSEMKSMYVALDKALTNTGQNDVKIYVAESASLQDMYDNSEVLRNRFVEGSVPDKQIYTFFDPKSPEYIGNLRHLTPLIAGHCYNGHKTNQEIRNHRVKLKEEMNRYKLTYHQSEWCMLPNLQLPMDGFTSDWSAGDNSGMQPALLMGRLIHADLVYADAESWGYWVGMSIGGRHALTSLYPTDGDILKGGLVRSNKTLWALGNYSFFIRPGYVRVDLEGADDLDTLVSSAFLSPDKSRLVVVHVNSSFQTIPVAMSFLNIQNKKIKKMSVYKTDERTDLANMYVSEKFNPVKVFDVMPRSLVTMVIDF